MKQLHDGSWVNVDTPTRLRNGKRYILSQDEIDAKAAADALYVANSKTVDKVKGRIKEEAARRILEIAPEWKQRRAQTFWLRMAELKADGGTPTAQQLANLATAKQLWDDIDAVRDKSDVLEANVDGMDDPTRIAFDPFDAANWV